MVGAGGGLDTTYHWCGVLVKTAVLLLERQVPPGKVVGVGTAALCRLTWVIGAGQ